MLGKEPPCEQCKPELLPENEDSIFVFSFVRNQVVTAGMGQVIGINHLAISNAIRLFEIDNEKKVTLDVIKCFDAVLETTKDSGE